MHQKTAQEVVIASILPAPITKSLNEVMSQPYKRTLHISKQSGYIVNGIQKCNKSKK